MADFIGYLDDSGDDGGRHNAVVIAGYLAPQDAWYRFECGWRAALQKLQVPYFHMKEIAKPTGCLAKFSGKQNEPARSAFFQDLIQVIKDAGLTGVGALVRLPDLRDFNTEKSLHLEAMPLALYGCMAELYSVHRDETIELVLDRFDKAPRAVEVATEYARSHWSDDASQNIRFTFLQQGFSVGLPLTVRLWHFVRCSSH